MKITVTSDLLNDPRSVDPSDAKRRTYIDVYMDALLMQMVRIHHRNDRQPSNTLGEIGRNSCLWDRTDVD
jgi:hypothetical protein